MAESSLIINATDQAGNKLQRTMTFASDTADRDKMLTFAQGINGLLTNNFVEAKRVQKVSLDDDPDGGWKPGSGGDTVIPYPEATATPDASKTTPTLTLASNSITAAAIKTATANSPYYYEIAITYDGDGIVYIDYLDSSTVENPQALGVENSAVAKIVNDNGWKLRLYCDAYGTDEQMGFSLQCTGTVRSTTTDTCNPASATFTVTNN